MGALRACTGNPPGQRSCGRPYMRRLSRLIRPLALGHTIRIAGPLAHGTDATPHWLFASVVERIVSQEGPWCWGWIWLAAVTLEGADLTRLLAGTSVRLVAHGPARLAGPAKGR